MFKPGESTYCVDNDSMKSFSLQVSEELFALNVTPRAPDILTPTLSELEFGENNTIYEPTCNDSRDEFLANEKRNLDSSFLYHKYIYLRFSLTKVILIIERSHRY